MRKYVISALLMGVALTGCYPATQGANNNVRTPHAGHEEKRICFIPEGCPIHTDN